MITVSSSLAHLRRLVCTLAVSVVALTLASPSEAQLPAIARGDVDLVVVYKSDRSLHLKSKGRIVRSYDIALGVEPKGHKFSEGDGRTPEGVYTLDWRNADSRYHRSIHISYPRDDDRAAARRWGQSPGGMIMIHGLPNGREASDMNHPINDWTNGCLAVTNEEMDEIWSLVEDGTTIIIFP